ncbi:MAG: hypothetical protein IJQ32_00945 [Paludibacteraceae bacterium]|nr:hypothetical protein [Paludibacteraceae bacterium]
MKISIAGENFEISGALLSAIVRSIDKAISEDVPGQLRVMPLETNNYLAFIRGDFINQNLRAFAIEEGGYLHAFHRFGWSGRILISRESKLTVSITTQNNLSLIPRRTRQRPHFMQSILHCMNGDLRGRYEQTRLFDTDPFEPEDYARDFEDIINGTFDPEEGYRHCVIAYRAYGDELLDVKLVVLDPQFNTVIEESLNEYMKPDFARLTDPAPAEEATREEHNAVTRRLTSLKQGVKPALREGEKEA